MDRVGEALTALRGPSAVTVLGLPAPEPPPRPAPVASPGTALAKAEPASMQQIAAGATAYELAKALGRIRTPERWIEGGVINARIATPLEGGLARIGPSGLGYADLRDLADSADLMRLAIEDAKAMIVAADWELEVKGGGAADARAEALCMKPDGEQEWDEWAGQLVEELLVTDCQFMFPWYRGGRLERLELIDGATIEIVPDKSGRIPPAPAKPFVQRAPGMPKREYSVKELWYRPRNRRLKTIRGFPPVEQIVMRAEITIHQTLVDLSRWIAGGIPPGVVGTPETMTLEQLQRYQEWLDDRLLNKANQSRLLAVAGNPKYAAVMAQTLDKNAAELLIRIVFHAMGADPATLISQINYSTADAMERWSRLRGVMPVLYYLKARAGEILAEAGFPNHSLVWKAEREARESLARKDDRDDYMVGLLAWEEARLRRGLPVEGPDGDRELFTRYHFALAQGQGIPGQPLSASPAAATAVPALAPTAEPGATATLAAPSTRALPAGAGVDALQDTALNGAQVTAAVEIVSKVAARELPREAGLGMLQAFFALSAEASAAIMGTVGDTFFAEAPAATVPPALPAGAEDEGGDPAGREDFGKAVRAELRRRRKVLEHDLRKGGAPRPFVWRLAPAWIQYRVEAGLQKGLPAREVFGDWLTKAAVTTGVKDDPAAERATTALAAFWERFVTTVLEHYQAEAAAYFERVAPALSKAGGTELEELRKAARNPDLPPPTFAPDVWNELVGLLEGAYEAGDRMAAGIVGYGSKAARTYAERMAAEYLGRRWDGTQWVERAGLFSVPDSVRQEVHDLVVTAVDEGWSVGTLNNELYLKFESTPGRSLTIARTETGMAYNSAAAASYEAAGVEKILVYDGPGCLPLGHDDDAEAPEDVEGLQLDREANGQIWTITVAKQYMLGHPNCGRVFSPVMPN